MDLFNPESEIWEQVKDLEVSDVVNKEYRTKYVFSINQPGHVQLYKHLPIIKYEGEMYQINMMATVKLSLDEIKRSSTVEDLYELGAEFNVEMKNLAEIREDIQIKVDDLREEITSLNADMEKLQHLIYKQE